MPELCRSELIVLLIQLLVLIQTIDAQSGNAVMFEIKKLKQ